MSEIVVERDPDTTELESRGVMSWPVWEKEISTFPWTYDDRETCYVLEGEVVVTPDGGTPVTIQAGDYVTFPAGMSCTWEVRQPIRKHFSFG
ncbi:MAG: cupin domain-containing protein [Gammaproteobacteria bacterium]|nr:cupin domain-containing protein [Gammaproteobacteria bacterium]